MATGASGRYRSTNSEKEAIEDAETNDSCCEGTFNTSVASPTP
jgi:hypothetical protein